MEIRELQVPAPWGHISSKYEHQYIDLEYKIHQ